MDGREPQPSSRTTRAPRSATVPRGFDPAFLDATRALWQARASRPLTSEDARQIAENVTGFVQILLQWDAAERSAPDVSRADSVTQVPDRSVE